MKKIAFSIKHSQLDDFVDSFKSNENQTFGDIEQRLS